MEEREGVSVSVKGSVMEDTIGKELGEGWDCSGLIVGVSRVEQRERSMAMLERIVLVATSVALDLVVALLLGENAMAVLERIMSAAIAVALAWYWGGTWTTMSIRQGGFGEGRREVDVVVALALERILSVVMVVALV